MGTVTPIRPLKQGSFEPSSFAGSYDNLRAIVEEIQHDKIDSNSPRTKIIACPTYLTCEYQRIHAECHLERGLILSAFIHQGLNEIEELPGVKSLDRICKIIRSADSSVLSLHSRSILKRNIGTSQSPSIVIKHELPCGEVEMIQFRHPSKCKSRLSSSAEEMGIWLSSLAIVAMGIGMNSLCSGEGLDREARHAIFDDRDQLDEKSNQQAGALRSLYDFYRGQEHGKITRAGRPLGRPRKPTNV